MRIDPDNFEASKPVKEFIRQYDRMLDIAHADAKATARGLRLVTQSNRQLESAWIDVGKGLTSGDFTEAAKSIPAARRSLRRIQRTDQVRRARGSIKQRMDRAAAPLVELANDEPDVSDFFSEVEETYPDSVLNSIIVKRGG